MIASVNNELSSPTPVGPAERIDSTTPTFEWGNVPSATSYRLVVENTTDGTTPVNLSSIADTSYTPTSALLPYKNYQWRVQTSDGANQSCFSDDTRFEIFTALLSVDVPTHGTSVCSPFPVSGWAIDRAASTGTGVDAVHVWAFPPGGEGIFLGAATLGIAQPGVGAAYGEQFTPSGYQLNVTTPLPLGGYTLRVYARSTVTGTFNNSRTVDITVTPDPNAPLMVVDVPQPGASVSVPFALAGWAIDRAASTGTGVDAVHVWAFPPGGYGNFSDGIFLGAATLGIEQPGVGAAYGAQFTPSGYHLDVTTPLPQGGYTLGVYARSTVTGTFNNSRTVDITVAPDPNAPLMVVDVPQPGASVSVPFALAGWAIDRAASTGTGVDAVHVWAFPPGGDGIFSDGIFLGGATLGIERPGVGAAYGAQFTPSGYHLDVTTPLPQGGYTLRAYARSTVTGTFNNSRAVDVTVAPDPNAPLMVVDAPQPGASVSVPFALAGWAIDRAASTGTGVDAVHVWAFPPGGDGIFSDGIFLGAATLGIAQPGVGAAYGAQFIPSGYHLDVTTPLPQGGYTLRAYARSTVTDTFNNSRAVDITVTP